MGRPLGLTPEEAFHYYMPGPPPEGTCWDWKGPRTTAGYGHYYVGPAGRNEHFYAHRMSHEIYNGPIPDGEVVRHSCDRPQCVHPGHLSTGTQSDNWRDSQDRGRAVSPPGGVKGEQHGHSKITEDDVRAIRSSPLPQRVIAEQYGLCQQSISLIVQRKNWSHVV